MDVELVRDLTGDGIPEVVLRTWNGGAHGSFVYYIFSADVRLRCLLAYYKGNDQYGPEQWTNFAVEDLDGDGRQAIVTCYDGFAYWGTVEKWTTCYPGNTRVPIVLGYRSGRYVDVTTRYRPWLRQKLARAKQHLLNDLDEVAARGGDQGQGLIEYYSVALLLYRRGTVRAMVLGLLPAEKRAVFIRNCGAIEKTLAERRRRYAYPRPYSQVQAFAREAIGG